MGDKKHHFMGKPWGNYGDSVGYNTHNMILGCVQTWMYPEMGVFLIISRQWETLRNHEIWGGFQANQHVVLKNIERPWSWFPVYVPFGQSMVQNTEMVRCYPQQCLGFTHWHALFRFPWCFYGFSSSFWQLDDDPAGWGWVNSTEESWGWGPRLQIKSLICVFYPFPEGHSFWGF